MPSEIVPNLKNFRDKIYHFFTHRKDAALNLLDALSSNTSAKSVMDLSLSPLHHRNYCSITRVVSKFYFGAAGIQEKNNELTKILCGYCQPPQARPYHLFAADCTSGPRPFSPTQEDRSFVYAPNGVTRKKPVTIGHKYSVTAYLPEKEKIDPPWLIPLACARVSTQEKGTMVGLNQINYCLSQEVFSDKLCVSVLDSEYSNHECLTEAKKNKNNVAVARLKSNRVLYIPPDPLDPNEPKKGRLKKFGQKFNLKNPETWPEYSQKITVSDCNKKGEEIEIRIQSWDKILMRDKRGSNLSDTPMRLIRIAYVKKESQEELFRKPLWLLVYGKRCQELSLIDVFKAYRQRFDLEHFFRFGKNNLLMGQFQTPVLRHEEAWWQLILLSYFQLYLAKGLATHRLKPWEKNCPAFKLDKKITPTQVQRCFGSITKEIGTPAKISRGHRKAQGRKKGELQTKRIRHPVVVKKKTAQPGTQQA